ncbi:hypothetical protein RN001_016060 [Aquatica leii]|uniref:Uncharacterized protein n=1 Tax=Aquatica leii TaxID=1421715 RepID=A0AAN7S5Y8_9COLE|nr:hypothetical protein RN001_016060 [Aquatica leii]
MATLTRAKDSNCPLFGVRVPFNENVLPTYCDILRQYIFTHNNTSSTSSGISNKSRALLTITYAQMHKTLPTAARECDRWGLSDRSAAAVSSALLQDLGIVTENDTASVIDRSKIRRERQKCRSKLQSDGRKNLVL